MSETLIGQADTDARAQAAAVAFRDKLKNVVGGDLWRDYSDVIEHIPTPTNALDALLAKAREDAQGERTALLRKAENAIHNLIDCICYQLPDTQTQVKRARLIESELACIRGAPDPNRARGGKGQ